MQDVQSVPPLRQTLKHAQMPVPPFFRSIIPVIVSTSEARKVGLSRSACSKMQSMLPERTSRSLQL